MNLQAFPSNKRLRTLQEDQEQLYKLLQSTSLNLDSIVSDRTETKMLFIKVQD